MTLLIGRNRWLVVSLLLVISSLLSNSPQSVTAAGLVQNDRCTMPFEHVATPLTELGNQQYIRMDGSQTDFRGGLYSNGSNFPPANHASAGERIARNLVPLDNRGEVNVENGKIVMVSIGMSNTAQEFAVFERSLRNNRQVNPSLQTINGAVGGRTAEHWVDPASDAWVELFRRLDHAGVPPEQVQIAWIKLTMVRGGEFPEKAERLQQHLSQIVQHLKDQFPNLQIAYLSSRTRSYTYWRGLSPEPVAFETGYAVKWLIEDQITGDPNLNYEAANGPVRAPFLLWGPYLWANGEIPRKDGFVWTTEDLTRDCTHPSEIGKQKIADLMLDFFLNDPISSLWFTRSVSESSQQASPIAPEPAQSTDIPPTHTIAPVEGMSPTEPVIALTPTREPPATEAGASFRQGVLTGIAASAIFVMLFFFIRRWRSRR